MTKAAVKRWDALTNEEIDRVLLLIARGASLAKAGEEVGLSGKTLERWLPRALPDAYRAALDGRGVLARRHGTRSTYAHGCRCLDCTDASNLYMRGLRKAGNPPSHGTLSAYRNHGCRCEACKAAGTMANARLAQQIDTGQVALSHGTAGRYDRGCRCYECSQEGLRISARASARNHSTLINAGHAGQQWTGPEMETLVTRTDLTNEELASALGRSLYAIVRRKSLVRRDLKWAKAAGVSNA